MSFTESFYSYLLHQKKYSANTVAAYKNDIESFGEYLKREYEGMSIEEVEDTIARSWFATLMEDGLKAISIKRKKASLTAYFKYLLKQGKVSRNPVKNITTPKPEKRLPSFVPESKIKELFSVDFFEISEYSDLRNRMILETLYLTGMRVSELTSLRDSSFDFSNNQLKVIGKRDKERLIPVLNIYKKMTEHYLEIRNTHFYGHITEDSFFLTEKGKKICRKFAYRVIFSYLSSVTSMKKKSPHVMRHTFATHLLNEGAEINAIKDILGHTSLAATQIYTHNTIEKLKRVYNDAHPHNQKRRKL
jgi:integrase/recombinase XerC